MRYVFVDDSIPYDGYTPLRRALGGPEKAVAGLAAALSARSNDVKVINRTAYAHMADGAYYTPFGDDMAPKSADVLIAMRNPTLLGTLRQATHRMLWVPGAADYLATRQNRGLLESLAPSLMFVSESQQRAYRGEKKRILVTPGVRNVFSDPPVVPVDPVEYGEAPASPRPDPGAIPPPHAVVTTHPLQGLSWLIDLWSAQVHPQLPAARLAIYSAILTKGLKGEGVPADVMPVLDKVKAAAAANVVVVEPRSDDGMVEVYRASRVHLYPGDARDFACWTLAESQAAGLPAVARGIGGTEERIINGQSGYIVPDADAFANVTLEILRNDAVYKSLSESARDVTRLRTWAMAAEELDAFVATL